MKRFIALWLILLTLSWYPVQAARTFNGSTQWLTFAGSPFGDTLPFTLMVWFYPTAAASNGLVELSVSGGNRHYLLFHSGGTVQSNSFDGSSSTAVTSTTATLNTWNLAVGRWVTTTDRRVTLNGGGEGTAAGAKTLTGLNQLRIGAQSTLEFSGSLAWAAGWASDVQPAEISALAGGANPFCIQRDNLRFVVPMWGTHDPEIDIAAARAFTLVAAPTVATHGPPVRPFGGGCAR